MLQKMKINSIENEKLVIGILKKIPVTRFGQELINSNNVLTNKSLSLINRKRNYENGYLILFFF